KWRFSGGTKPKRKAALKRLPPRRPSKSPTVYWIAPGFSLISMDTQADPIRCNWDQYACRKGQAVQSLGSWRSSKPRVQVRLAAGRFRLSKTTRRTARASLFSTQKEETYDHATTARRACSGGLLNTAGDRVYGYTGKGRLHRADRGPRPRITECFSSR